MEIEELLMKKLHCEIFRLEGIEGLGVKIFWNWQPCTYSGKCYYQKEKEENQPKPCSYNPNMFKCIAYQEFENGRLR